MTKTIADAIRHINITPEELGMTAINDKVRRGESIVAIIKHADGTKEKVFDGKT